MSGQLKEVRTRIASVQSTQKITKAMKLVAASKLRRATDRIVKIRPYANKLADMVRNIASATEGAVNLEVANARPVEKVLLILITSDRGLCGGFNAQVIKETNLLINGKYAAHAAKGNVTVWCIGKKGYDIMKRQSVAAVSDTYLHLFEDLNFLNATKAAEDATNCYVDKTFDSVEVIYNRFKNQVTQEPIVEQYLPIAKPEVAADASKQNSDYIYEPDQASILKELMPKILKTQFYRYLLDSNASENGARMTAMDKATENAEDMLRELKLKYNRARQAAITTEIIEIVSGAAALKG